MRKFLSLTISASLVFASAAPALAEGVVRTETAAPKVLPVISVGTQLAPSVNAGLETLSTLPAVNSIDAQAIDAASLIGPAQTAIAIPGAELTTPASITGTANLRPAASDLNAAVQASVDDADADAGVTATAQLGRVETAGLTGDKEVQDKAWTGLRDSVADVPVMTSGPVSRFSTLRRAGIFAAQAAVVGAVALDSNIALAGTGQAPAAHAGIAHWFAHIVSQYSGYLSVAATAAAIYGVNRGVQKIIERVARHAGWEKSTTVVVKRAATLGVLGLGTVIGLHVGGAPVAVITAVAGLGTTAVTMASKTILGNALEASKVLLYHSFKVGDRVKIGDDNYTVKDLSLRYVTFQNEAYKTSPTNFTYLQLASTPLTILHPYEANHKINLNAGVTVGTVAKTAGKTITSASRKTWLWLLGTLAVAIGASYAAPLVVATPIALTALTYLKAAAIFGAAHNIRSFVLDFITKLSEKAGWHQQTTLVTKLVAEVLAYTIGGSWALRALGTSWMMVLGGLGTTSIAFTLVTQDILSNLVTAGWLMSDRNKEKSIKIGENLLVGRTLGKVIDMNFQYVVLDLGDGTHSLISYAYLKDTAFTIISDMDLAAAKAKYRPDPPLVPTTK